MKPKAAAHTRRINCNPRSRRSPRFSPYVHRGIAAVGLLLSFLLISSGSTLANVRVNQDNPGQIQNSPSIQLDQPSSNIIVGYVDTPGTGNGCGASYRALAGGNWIDSNFPVFGWHGWEQDPSVASDAMGIIFLCQASYDQQPPSILNPGGAPTTSGIYVSMSVDGGISFLQPSQVSLLTGTLPREMKPKIEVDDFAAAGSPFAGNAYVTWQRDLNTNPPSSNALFSRSTDGGMTWVTPFIQLNSNPPLNQTHSPDLAVGSDGSIVAAWVNTPTWVQQGGVLQPQQGQIWVNRSVDGGQTFSPAVAAVTFQSVPQLLTDLQNPAQGSYPAESYVSVEVDPSNPNRIGAVYTADPDDGAANEVRIDFGDLPPGTSDALLLDPLNGGHNISCNRTSPNWVYSVWSDFRYGADVFFSRGQIVGGIANWTGDMRLTTEPAGQHVGGYNPVIASSGSNVYVAWDEWAGVDFYRLIWFNRSTDYGATWLPQAIPLDTQMQVAYSARPSISCSGNNVCVAWEVGRTATQSDIYCNYSTDAGWTWQASEIPIRTGVWSMDPQIAQAGNYVVCVWNEAFGIGPNSDIYASYSMNYGASWSGPTRLNFNDPIGNSQRYSPKVCANQSGGFFVVWDDQRVNGVDNPYYAYSTNFGIVWQGDFRLNTGVAAGANRDYWPQIACHNNYVAVVYESDRAQLGGPEDVYLNCSIDGGITWLTPDVRQDLGTPAAGSGSVHPRVSVYDYGYPYDAYFYTTWMDDRNSTPYNGWDIYGTYGMYNPASGAWWWLPWDYRIDVGDPPGANESWNPHVDSDWTGPFYVYRDERDGQGDIYANQYQTGPDEGDIFYIESTNAGLTWSTPLRVNDDLTTNDQSHPWIDIKPNGIVDVGWLDKRNDVLWDQNTDEYFASLLPGGTAFNPNVLVTTQPIVAPPGGNWWIGDYTGLEVDATDAHLAWPDTRRAGDNFMCDVFYHIVGNPQIGACCLPSGLCAPMTPAACAAQGGQYVGDGVPCDPNPCEQEDQGDHDVGNTILTVTDQGIVGFMDATQQVGSGFVYPRERQGVNQLYIGSVWVGVGPDYVANRDYDDDPDREWVVSTEPDGHIWFDESGWVSGTGSSDQDIHAGFTDALAGVPRDLYVEQVSWAYGAPEAADEIILMNYRVENRGPAALDEVYVGLFMDFDLDPTAEDDEGAVVAERNLIYMHDPSGVHTGVVLLEPGGDPTLIANLTLIHNPTFVWPNGYVLDPDKVGFLSASDPEHVLTESFEPNDYSVLASAGPFTLGAGEETVVSFGIVAGMSREEVEQHSDLCRLIVAQGIVDLQEPEIPLGVTRLLPSAPNPFESATMIRYELAEEQSIRLVLYDLSGRRVRTLAEGIRSAGLHVLPWDGTDQVGREVAAGIYFLSFTTSDGSQQSRPIVRMR